MPKAIDGLRQQFDGIATELVEALVSRAQFDTVTEFASILPLTVVRDLIGLPAFGRTHMLKWASGAFDIAGIQSERGQKGGETTAEMRDFVRENVTAEDAKEGSVRVGLLRASLLFNFDCRCWFPGRWGVFGTGGNGGDGTRRGRGRGQRRDAAGRVFEKRALEPFRRQRRLATRRRGLRRQPWETTPSWRFREGDEPRDVTKRRADVGRARARHDSQTHRRWSPPHQPRHR